MTDWVVVALVGLGIEPQQAADVAEIFRSIRTMPEPDALQVLLGVVHETANQAQDADEQLAAERQRGDQYRARALALLKSLRIEREVTEYLDDIYHQAEDDFTNTVERLAIAEHELAAERATAARLAGLLLEAQDMMGHDVACLGDIGRECQCRYAGLMAEIDAALAAQLGGAPPCVTGGRSAAETGDER